MINTTINIIFVIAAFVVANKLIGVTGRILGKIFR